MKTYTLHRVNPEVRLELERIHRGRLEIEVPDEMNPRREELLEAGWLSTTETMFGGWLEISPVALVGPPGNKRLRPNGDFLFVYDEVIGWRHATAKEKAAGPS